jgi:hypothetical protein
LLRPYQKRIRPGETDCYETSCDRRFKAVLGVFGAPLFVVCRGWTLPIIERELMGMGSGGL